MVCTNAKQWSGFYCVLYFVYYILINILLYIYICIFVFISSLIQYTVEKLHFQLIVKPTSGINIKFLPLIKSSFYRTCKCQSFFCLKAKMGYDIIPVCRAQQKLLPLMKLLLEFWTARRDRLYSATAMGYGCVWVLKRF